MRRLTKKEIEELFEKTDGYKFSNSGTFHGLEFANDEIEDLGYKISLEKDFGGYEGAGEETWKVFKLTSDDSLTYFRINGYYSSWVATEWDDSIEIVEPREVTVIKYFKVGA